MKRIFLFLAILIFMFLQIPLAHSKPNNSRKARFVPDEVIIKLKENKKIDSLDLDAGKAKKLTIGKNKHFIKMGLDRLYLLKVKDAIEAIRVLEKHPSVEYVEPNYIVTAISTFPNDEEFSSLYGLHNTGQKGGTPDADIDAPEAWDIQRGSDAIVVAVIDTGVDYTHEDLVDNMWVNVAEIPDNGLDDDDNGYVDDDLGWDFVNNDNDPFDDQGHGTHCSGIIGAVGNNGIGVVGVSWNVSIMPLKFLNSGGSGSTADAILAVEYATMMHVDIMSNSWGGGGFSEALEEAIIAANYGGILFVASAGNGNSNNDLFPHYPSNYHVPNVIAVAATDRNDDLASFSNYGALSVDLGAPGVDILSTVPNGSCQLCDPTGYILLSGTSMATPHIAGAAALIKANFPGLTIEQLKARLLRVDPNPALEAITVTGGRLNTYNSLEEDNVPPDAVIDLAADNPKFNSITLTWTATGDNGAEGTASSYDVRYSTSPIDDDEDYNTATKATGEPSPQPPYSTETFTVTGLSQSTRYYFAMKVIDNVGNTSGLSNRTDETTTAPTVIFEDDMESGASGWSFESLWHMEDYKWHSFQTSWAYNTGDPSYNYDIDYSIKRKECLGNWGSLTSPVIDLSSYSSAGLTFWNWYYTEPWPSWDQRWVQIGVDGVFSNLDQLYGDPMVEWNETTFDISSYAGKSIQIRFFFDTIDCDFNTYEGWYIDDVTVYGDLLEPNTEPVADVGGPYSGTENESVTFDGSGSSDADGDPLNYHWDFGDGETGGGVSPTHSYLWGGTFEVTLTVSDGRGGTDAVTTTATVHEVNDQPVARANGPYTGTVGEAITFDGSGSYDYDNLDGNPDNNQTLTYAWTFGDGSAGNLVNPTHTYNSADTYTVTLVVNDGVVDSDPASTAATLNEPSSGPSVTKIVVRVVQKGPNHQAIADVYTEKGTPVSGVFFFNSSPLGSDSDTAGGRGFAKLESDKVQGTSGSDVFRININSPTSGELTCNVSVSQGTNMCQ